MDNPQAGHIPPSIAPESGRLHKLRHLSFWIRELPFSLVLILTMIGVAYISFSKKPITGYWELLAPLIALVCVGSGWAAATNNTARVRLIATQVLHWFAFLLVMNMLLLSSVQRVFTASATGLAIFTLLALGTFTAGVHVLSWQVCLLGLIMALGIPAIAWVENSALVFLLIAAAIIGIVVVVWWHFREPRPAAKP
ncbi:MAG TPA: hypothetical protein VHW71_11375 [Steroidobacteraceae bacterium]|jgi:hypothetical protein|nr:hypothetical protein [Steroidobacteraceae bacterium]